MIDTDRKIFISCTPGLEPVLKDECRQIGLSISDSSARTQAQISCQGVEEEKGGIEFSGNEKDIYLCNLHLRTASRVVVRLGEFYAAAFSELRKKAGRLEWERYVLPSQEIDIRVTCHKSRLYHSDAVAERIRGSIEDRLHHPLLSSGKKPGQLLILVRLVSDFCSISIDSSGELLHRRGYRQAVAKAPLRETLAAGMLLSSGWQPGIPLIDPFCGSGTIPIEAALMAHGIAPGINRRFGFMNWAGYDPGLYEDLLSSAKSAIHPSDTSIYASDRDCGAIEAASANAARTGVNLDVSFACHAVSDLPLFTDPGWIVTNPPYGVRISQSKDLRNLYASFGRLFLTRFQGWKLAVLCSDPVLIGSLGLGKAMKTVAIVNGGIPVKLSIFDT